MSRYSIPKTSWGHFGLIILSLTTAAGGSASLSGCMRAYQRSVGSDTSHAFQRVYLTDYNTAWLSVLDALKSSPLEVLNREAGSIQTKWTDNTSDRNFTDSVGGVNAYLRARYRFQVGVSKGFYNGQPSVKVTVLKEQLVQRDVLEEWRPIETDSIDENTLLYRIGRIINMRMKLNKLEEQKLKKAIEGSQF